VFRRMHPKVNLLLRGAYFLSRGIVGWYRLRTDAASFAFVAMR